jgi:hypothetical protein
MAIALISVYILRRRVRAADAPHGAHPRNG